MFTLMTILALLALFIVTRMFRIVHMREAGVKERVGKFAGTLNPGFHFLIPFVDRIAYRHEMREQVIDVPPQVCITRDNIQVEVDGVVYLKVMDPVKASYGISDYRLAGITLAQTTMRSEIGKLNLEQTFSERETINENVVRTIDQASQPWGVKMIRYEIRNITPSEKMIDTMEKQMEAERHKRAEITLGLANKESRINLSEGERQEAINLSEGEKQKRINEAQGDAKEIALVAEATADGIRRIASAIRKPGGEQAIKMRIIEQFIDEFGNIIANTKVSVVPTQLAALGGVFEGLTKLTAATAAASASVSATQTQHAMTPTQPTSSSPGKRRLPGTAPVK